MNCANGPVKSGLDPGRKTIDVVKYPDGRFADIVWASEHAVEGMDSHETSVRRQTPLTYRRTSGD